MVDGNHKGRGWEKEKGGLSFLKLLKVTPPFLMLNKAKYLMIPVFFNTFKESTSCKQIRAVQLKPGVKRSYAYRR